MNLDRSIAPKRYEPDRARGLMHAFSVASFGQPPTIHKLPIPAEDGEFLIRVTYAGLNPLDSILVDRLTAASSYPFVMGVDFAGVIVRVPPGVHNFRTGDRVFGIARTHGSYAEYTALARGVGTEPLARIPDGVSDDQAAALPIAGITALRSIELLNVGAGRRLVVMGAAGAVGGYAVQIAHARGAHVIATVRSDADEARRLGAEEVYDTNTLDVLEAIRAAHPDGVDAVFDLVSGKDAIRHDAEVLKSKGALVSTQYAADETWFAERRITATNISSSTNPLSSPQGLEQLAEMLAHGTITARIRSTVDLDGVPQILEQLRHGGLRGKAVIRL
jgi:NADPH:quinone reductase-like Zn-dependent oxidoreductase